MFLCKCFLSSFVFVLNEVGSSKRISKYWCQSNAFAVALWHYLRKVCLLKEENMLIVETICFCPLWYASLMLDYNNFHSFEKPLYLQSILKFHDIPLLKVRYYHRNTFICKVLESFPLVYTYAQYSMYHM